MSRKTPLDNEIDKALGNSDMVIYNKDVSNHNQIAEQIRQERDFLFCDGIYYEYKDGVYSSVKEDYLRKIIKDKLGNKFSQNKANEILASLRVDIAVNDNEELNKSEYLNLKNGMLDLKTLALLPHCPDYKSIIQLQVSYNPNASCNKWVRTLQEIFADDLYKADILQEFFGLCLTKETKYEKALFIIGEGANGKSTILYILQKILSKRNYSSIPLEQFNNTHYTANLYNKLANISIETNAKSSVYDALMKAVISGDTITADFKYLPTFQFNPFCKLIFALNSMPRVDDKTDAYFRRLIIISFKRQFSEEKQNKDLKKELAEEIDGIFIWMLNGLKRLQERGYFELDEALRNEVEEYRKENNNVLTFTEEECSIDPQASVTKQDLYNVYAVWCDHNGYKGLSKKKFGKEIAKHYPKITDGRNSEGDARIWLGIGLTNTTTAGFGRDY